MIRAPLGDCSYWDEWVDYAEDRFKKMLENLLDTSGDISYRPQYFFEFAKNNWHQILRRYSRGDSVRELGKYFPPLLNAWEKSNRANIAFVTPEELEERRNWSRNLDHYIVCFWLVGLALALEIPDDQWQRLLALMGNEGEDELLDRVIASRQPGRRIGNKLCHPKPYQRLLDAINAPSDKQPKLLAAFVANWYRALNRSPKKGLSAETAVYDRPYWYTYGDRNFEGGAYFGRWCIEAVAVVIAFGLDDSFCLGHEHYPGDLVRPDGPSTHPPRPAEEISTQPEPTATDRPGIWSRLFGRK